MRLVMRPTLPLPPPSPPNLGPAVAVILCLGLSVLAVCLFILSHPIHSILPVR